MRGEQCCKDHCTYNGGQTAQNEAIASAVQGVPQERVERAPENRDLCGAGPRELANAICDAEERGGGSNNTGPVGAALSIRRTLADAGREHPVKQRQEEAEDDALGAREQREDDGVLRGGNVERGDGNEMVVVEIAGQFAICDTARKEHRESNHEGREGESYRARSAGETWQGGVMGEVLLGGAA